jgi:phospholipase/lecithinase/hemolysin
MGLPPPPLISTLNGTAAAAAKGVNFGGEEGENGGGGGVFRMGAIGQQLRLAAETLQLLRLEAAAPREGSDAVSGAVFVVSFGADAYARLLARGSEADASAPKHGRRGFGRLLAGRVARAVQELYEAGVRRVAVVGVPPLGCAPRVMWEGLHLVDGRGCVEEANELIQGYNARLEARLDALRPQLPGADVVFCDVYKGVMEMITNPGAYGSGILASTYPNWVRRIALSIFRSSPLLAGFVEARDACCGLGPFGGTIGCLTREMACPTPQRHVWWDLYSPTEAVNSLLATWAWSEPPSDSTTSVCRPVTLQQLAGHTSADPTVAR